MMGYYDNNDFPHREKRERKSGRGGWFFAGLVGAIFGVLVTLTTTPILSKYGILPYDANSQPAQTNTKQVQPTPTNVAGNKTINVDVNSATTKAVNKIFNAVVGVINYQNADLLQNGSQPEGLGSGFIYKKKDGEAYIITNNHVVEGASKLEVSIGQGDKIKVPATLVGTDPLMDLAVLKIHADHVKGVAQLGNSDNIKHGEMVIAIGNPLGFSGSVTEGIVSATDRTVPRDTNGDSQPDWNAEVIQTDAAINPGNSGGALINLDGQVVGINSMKIAETSVEGIGFAIPINVAKPIIAQIERYGKVQRPYIGIYFSTLSQLSDATKQRAFNLPSDIKAGVIVRSIVPGGPADRAGLQPADVIVAMDGQKIEDVLDFRKKLYKDNKPGDELKLSIYRNGEKLSKTLTLGQEK